MINQKLSEITSEIQKNLNAAEKGDLASLEQLTDVDIEVNQGKRGWDCLECSFGQATNMALLGNLGPKIPVRFHAIGEVRPDVKINPKPMGINNTWIDVAITSRSVCPNHNPICNGNHQTRAENSSWWKINSR